jgi:hypothetical protein
MSTLVFVFSEEGDWTSVFKDGRFYEGGHSIPGRVYRQLLREAGYDVQTAEAPLAWFEQHGSYPRVLPDDIGPYISKEE